MMAAILSIGDEFTYGDKVDAHAAWLSAHLAELTIATTEHRTVGDDRNRIAEAIRELAADREVLIAFLRRSALPGVDAH